MIPQDLRQAHYEILSIIFLKEFIEFIILDMTIRNVKHVELNMSIATVFLNIKNYRWFNVWFAIRIAKESLMEN